MARNMYTIHSVTHITKFILQQQLFVYQQHENKRNKKREKTRERGRERGEGRERESK